MTSETDLLDMARKALVAHPETKSVRHLMNLVNNLIPVRQRNTKQVKDVCSSVYWTRKENEYNDLVIQFRLEDIKANRKRV